MNFGKVAALTVLLVGSLALDTLATAQELFGVHVIAVNRFHSPVEITEFIFGKGDNAQRPTQCAETRQRHAERGQCAALWQI